MKEQILEKLKDEKFVEKLFVCESVEQVKDFFKDSGVEITKEEAQEVIDGMVMLSQKMLSLSEEELEACSGGSEVGRITSNISQEFTKAVGSANQFIQDNAELIGGMAIGGTAVAGTILACVGAYKVGKYIYRAIRNNSKLITIYMKTSKPMAKELGLGATTNALISYYKQ